MNITLTDPSILDNFSYLFPFPSIVTPILIVIGVLVAAKITGTVLKVVFGVDKWLSFVSSSDSL